MCVQTRGGRPTSAYYYTRLEGFFVAFARGGWSTGLGEGRDDGYWICVWRWDLVGNYPTSNGGTPCFGSMGQKIQQLEWDLK